MSREIDVTVSRGAWRDCLRQPEAVCAKAADAALRAAGAAGVPVELGIVLTDDATIAALNHDYRGREGPTDVLSFPAEEGGPRAWKAARQNDGGNLPPVILGDVVIAHETVMAAAVEQGVALTDHLPHLIVHGVLHLLGYDHQTDAEAARMEAMESAILVGLGHPDPNASEPGRRRVENP